jgi:hypothetical protein
MMRMESRVMKRLFNQPVRKIIEVGEKKEYDITAEYYELFLPCAAGVAVCGARQGIV